LSKVIIDEKDVMSTEEMEYMGYPLSPSTDSERTIAQTLDVSLKRSCCQIPFYVMTDRKIDSALFLQAFNEEIKRNDSLRMRWVSRGTRLKPNRLHYFIPEYSLDGIPELDFSKKSVAEMEARLLADTGVPLEYLKGEVFRVFLLHGPDGRDGFYMIVTHLNMDLFAMLLCARDLLLVYDALEKGNALPDPLYPYEELYKTDMEKEQNSELQEKYLQYYRDYYASIPKPSFYAGFDRMRILKKQRRWRMKPDMRFITHSVLNNPTSCKMKMEILPKEKVDELNDFCKAQSIPFQTLIMMGLRLHLSRWNERTDDIMMGFLSNRRATRKEQNSGGCRVNTIPFRAVIDNELTFRAASNELTLLLARTVKRSNLGFFPLLRFIQETEHMHPLSINISCYFSCLPPDSFPPLDGWEVEVKPVGLSDFPFFPYFLIQPTGANGEMSIAFIYQKGKFTDEDIDLALTDIKKALELGMKDPEMTLNQIIDRL